ncbi:MAG: class I SAM-dependent methyltransferase [Phycisphaerae bacterium]
MNINEYNSRAWDAEVERGNPWTIPVSREAIAAARNDDFAIVLTPQKPVPKNWFGDLQGARVLCLASGGGQQGPILAAAGAVVTVFDNSAKQLEQDRLVANRESLEIALEQGDMADLSRFADASFDLIFHPCSNCFVPDIAPVWRECARVLRVGGALLTGFTNPAMYIFDEQKAEKEKVLEVRHALPYNELTDLTDAERQYYVDRNEPLIFGHTLEQQIAGQLAAGFVLTDLFEDRNPTHILSKHMPTFVATRAEKRARRQ